jgi:hypothetical protein
MLKSGEIDHSVLPSNLMTDWKSVEDPLEDGENGSSKNPAPYLQN